MNDKKLLGAELFDQIHVMRSNEQQWFDVIIKRHNSKPRYLQEAVQRRTRRMLHNAHVLLRHCRR